MNFKWNQSRDQTNFDMTLKALQKHLNLFLDLSFDIAMQILFHDRLFKDNGNVEYALKDYLSFNKRRRVELKIVDECSRKARHYPSQPTQMKSFDDIYYQYFQVLKVHIGRYLKIVLPLIFVNVLQEKKRTEFIIQGNGKRFFSGYEGQ